MSSSDMRTKKRDFISWFLKNQQLKKREAIWIINYIMSNDNLLERVRFVENAKHCPCGLVISTTDTKGSALRYYKNRKVFSDGERIFNDIRASEGELIYIQLNFLTREPNLAYLELLEDNPYSPNEASLTEEEQQYINDFLHESLSIFQKKQLEEQIDAALDARDEARFTALCQQLQSLPKQN